MVQTNIFDLQDEYSPPFAKATRADNLHDSSRGSSNHHYHDSIPIVSLDGVPIVPIIPVGDRENDTQQGGDDNDDDNSGGNDEEEANVTVGAGVAGGVVGLLMGGPVLAVVAGFGSAYAAKQKEGAVGDAARAMGFVALEAQQRAIELDRKHHLVQKGKVVAMETWEKAKELDQQHHILQRTKEFLMWSWEAAREQNREHRLLERSMHAIGKAISFLVSKIGHAIQNDNNRNDKNSDHDEAQNHNNHK